MRSPAGSQRPPTNGDERDPVPVTTTSEPVIQTIGRASDNDVVVPHASVSAHHAELRQAGTAHRIVDLSSTNGTFVNGTRIQAQNLNDGDTVHLGPVALEYSNRRLQIQVHEPAEPPPPTPTPPVPQAPQPAPSAEISRKLLTVLVSLAVVAAIAVTVVVANSGSEAEDQPPLAPATSSTAPTSSSTAPTSSSTAPTTTEAPRTTPVPEPMEVNWEQLARSVVLVAVPDCDGDAWMGSGTIVLDGGHVLTNQHVVDSPWCEILVLGVESIKDTPVFIAYAEVIPSAVDQELDLAVLRLVDSNGRPTRAFGRTPIEIRRGEIELGAPIKLLGFPGMGGFRISMTAGEQSGWWEDDEFGIWEGRFYKTSAKMGPGISGGAAFDAETGEFVGVPTGRGADSGGEGDILGLVRPGRYALPLLDAAERTG